MKNKIFFALLLLCAMAATCTTQAQGFIGNGTGTGVKVVNSSGTLSGVNVGVGVAAPASGTTLEVADPAGGTLGLRFDQLPYYADSSILYYHPSTGVVTYGPLPAATVSAVDYDCGVGTVTVNGVTSAHRAWLLSGATTVDSNDYFGTYNNDDIRIATNNASCLADHTRRRMLISAGSYPGNVSIGMWDGTSDPTAPRNKLLVENGDIFTASTTYPDAYTQISSLTGLSPDGIGILSISNRPSTANAASVNLVHMDGSPANIGTGSLVLGDGSNNTGSVTFVSGNGNTGSNGNTGTLSIISGDNSFNTGVQANIDGNNSRNTGMQYLVGFNSTTTNINYGIVSQVTGSTSDNIGIQSEALGAASGYNTGVSGLAKNASNNVGVSSEAFTDNASKNFGVSSNAFGLNTTNVGVFGSIWSKQSSYSSGSTCVGVWGVLHSDTDVGNVNIGVEGDLSNLTPPSSGNTKPFFGVYGIAPLHTGSGASGTVTSGGNNNNSYAGYFDGDVFCSNTYYYSDPKLKENIADYTGALDQLRQLPVKSYTFRQKEFPSMNFPMGDQVGVLSTDLKKVFPGLVKLSAQPPIKGKGDLISYEAVNYNALIPVLVEAVKELDARKPDDETAKKLQAQQEQIAAQAQQIADLRAMISDLCTNGCAGFTPHSSTPAAQSAVLYQSVPNPASGTVAIGYSIDMLYTSASISIAAMDGKTIARYTISGQGAGSVAFDATGMAAGVYKYSLLIDGSIIDTKSMSVSMK